MRLVHYSDQLFSFYFLWFFSFHAACDCWPKFKPINVNRGHCAPWSKGLCYMYRTFWLTKDSFWLWNVFWPFWWGVDSTGRIADLAAKRVANLLSNIGTFHFFFPFCLGISNGAVVCVSHSQDSSHVAFEYTTFPPFVAYPGHSAQ
jgi:hypothetical protein